MFAPAWRDRTVDEDPGAPFFNETTKYVVGDRSRARSGARRAARAPTTPTAIRGSRTRPTGRSTSPAAASWCGACCADGLVDELHLFVYPIALGQGERLFAEGNGPTKLALLDQRRLRQRRGAPVLRPRLTTQEQA